MQRSRHGQWWDFVVAADPGLTRLTLALQAGLSVGVIIAVQYGFAQLLHPLWMSAPAGAHLTAAQTTALDAQHHGVTLLLMVVGGIFSMISTVAVSDVKPRDQAITLLGGPVPLLGTMAGAIALASHHWIGLAVLTLVVGGGTYARRLVPVIGPRAVYWGALMFIGFFFGFLAGAEIPLGQFGWMVASVWLSAVVNLLLRLAIYNRIAVGTLARAHRSFSARARRTIVAAADLVGASSGSQRDRDRKRLGQMGERLAENALIIDGQLADPRFRLDAAEAQHLHEQLFELQLDLENLARVATSFASQDFPPSLRGQALAWIAELRGGSTIAAEQWIEREGRAGPGQGDPRLSGLDDRGRDIVNALAQLVVDTGEALRGWLYPRPAPAPSTGAGLLTDIYESPVSLFAGNLVGSTQVSRAALDPATSTGLAARLHLDGAAQTAIRVMVAVGTAGALASIVSERRFYWAVIAVFISFMGANTTSEQVLKALNRVLGTFLGILIGSLLANLIGPSTWSLVVILPALMFGVYFTPRPLRADGGRDHDHDLDAVCAARRVLRVAAGPAARADRARRGDRDAGRGARAPGRHRARHASGGGLVPGRAARTDRADRRGRRRPR